MLSWKGFKFPTRWTVLKLPGLEPMVRRGSSWETTVDAPSLSTLRKSSLPSPHDWSEKVLPISDGETLVSIPPSLAANDSLLTINMAWLREAEAQLHKTWVDALLIAHPQTLRRFDHAYGQDDLLPRTLTLDNFSNHLELISLLIHPVPNSVVPYLGGLFRATWDEEHGMGILSYGLEVLEVGTQDVACDESLALNHREQAISRAKLSSSEF